MGLASVFYGVPAPLPKGEQSMIMAQYLALDRKHTTKCSAAKDPKCGLEFHNDARPVIGCAREFDASVFEGSNKLF